MKTGLEDRIGHIPKGVIESEDFLRMVQEAKGSGRFSGLSAIVVDATDRDGEWDVFRFLQKHVLHLGAVSVATLLKEYGFKESKAIYEVLTPDYPYQKEKPDLVGVSAIMSNVSFANRRLEEFRRMWPDALLVAGGSGYTFDQAGAISHGAHAAFAGKAAYPLLEFLNRVASARLPGESLKNAFLRTDVGDISGVYVAGNPFSTAGLAPMVKSLDAVPAADYSLIQGKQSKKVRPILDSEGCPGNCDFCSAVLLNGKKYRACSAERVVDEMIAARKDGARQVFLNGDDPLARPYGKIVELCDAIRGANLGITWFTQARMSDIYHNLDKGILDELERAHCSMLAIGMESINDADLKNMNASGKNSYEMSQAVLGALKKSPIEVHAMLIVKPFVKPEHRGNLPFSAEDSEQGIRDYRGEVKGLVDFLKKNNVRTAQFLSAVPAPGTEYPEKYLNAGILLKRVGDKRIGWSDYSGQRVVASSNPLESYNIMIGAYKDFYRWSEIARALSLEPPKSKLAHAFFTGGVGPATVYFGTHTKGTKEYLRALEKGDYEFYKPWERPDFK